MSRQAQLSNSSKVHFDVAAGILRDASGRVLIAERLGGGPFHGMWEFPGGKIGAQESALDALRRELLEELGIAAGEVSSFMKLHHEYPDRSVSIEFFIVRSWGNDVRGLEGQQLEWVDITDLDPHKLLPADLPVIDKLKEM